MSLAEFNTQINLFNLQKQLNFAESDKYRLFFEKIYPELVNVRKRISKYYCSDNGRPGIEPVLLLGVSLLQFMERVPDRQAIEQLRYHTGWKYALNQELNAEVFDASVLVRFRNRLTENKEGRMIFEIICNALERAGMISKRSRQRLDSTHVLGFVKRMSDLELIRESLRLALNELKPKLTKQPEFWELLEERYVENRFDYRASEEKLKSKLEQAGEDVWRLLCWLDEKANNKKSGPKCKQLSRVFHERFKVEENKIESIPIQKGCIQNPHDPEALYRTKSQGKHSWVGYMLQVAETVSEKPVVPGEPTKNFITSMVTQNALGSDESGMSETLAEQAEMNMDKPSELYVDGAYVSAKELSKAAQEKRELIGPAISGHKAKGVEFGSEEFTVDIEKRQAICPAGHPSPQCSRVEDRWNGIVEYRFEWSWRCKTCGLRQKCISSRQKHRTLRVGAKHMYLQTRRKEMQTKEFREKMKRRCGIEGTHSELVRGHGARRTRYRGLQKTCLQNYFIGAACNVKRWLKRMTWELTKTPMDKTALQTC